MGNRVSKYSIELQIDNGDKVRSTIDGLERGLKSISESAKSGDFSKGLQDASKQAEALEKQIHAIIASGEDATAEFSAFDKAAAKAVSDLEKQATELNHALSEQGTAQRQRIKALQDELSIMQKVGGDKVRQKKLEEELKRLQKDVIQGTDEELKNALKNNKAIRARLLNANKEAKLAQVQAKNEATFGKLLKADLKALREKIKLQFEFIKSLKKTETWYNLLKKSASKIGAGSMKLMKAGAIGAGGLVGGALALGGQAVSSASSMVDREREANRIKVQGTKDEKNALLGDLYTTTGADYTTIVDAINRVTSVLGTNLKHEDLVRATTAEIRYPGAAAMFRQQNVSAVTAKDFSVYQNRIQAIQSATGASVDQIQGATERVANMRQSSFSNASMTDLLAIYAGLQNSGAYDTQEELDRAFNSFVRSQKNSGESVFEHAKSFDWKARAYGATNKQQVATALQNMDWGRLESASSVSSSEVTQSEAERTAQKMRELQEKRNQMMMKLVEGLSPVLDAIKPEELSNFFKSLMNLVNAVAPYMSKLVVFLTETLGEMVNAITALIDWIKNSAIGKALSGDDDTPENAFVSSPVARQNHRRANGGLVSMPSIAGEGGFPEMVVPLDPARTARGAQLTQNLVQHFNLSGNETTALSLSQAIKSRGFTTALAKNSFINQRLGR